MTPHILIIDDELAHRTLAKRALKPLFEHCVISEADTVSSACSLLQQENNPVTLILLDLHLGTESGLKILNFIRSRYSREHLPVIILSTSRIDSEVEHCYREGANCFLHKSTEPAEYRSSLQAALRFFSC